MAEDVKFLYGASGVPVTARRLGGSVGGTSDYNFGVDRVRTIAVLRELANAMERGEAVLQNVKRTVDTPLDDFELTTLAITYAQKQT